VPEMTRKERISIQRNRSGILSRVWLYVLIGVGIGAAIHNWIPQSIIENVVGGNNPFAVIACYCSGHSNVC
jgi:Predicted permeases